MKKHKVNRLNGAIWNTLGSTMYGANSFIMLALVSRISTVDDAGFFGIAFTTSQLMYIVGLLGINHYQQTDYAEKYLYNIYVYVKVFSSALMYVGAALTIVLFRFEPQKAFYTISLTVLMMLNSVGEMYQSLFFQKNRLDLSGSCLFFRTFWSLFAFCCVLLVSKSVLLAVGIQIVANLIVTLYYRSKYVPFFVQSESGRGLFQLLLSRDNQLSAQKLVVECLPLFISLFLMNAIINSSKYGIELMMDSTTQGYYNMIFIPAQIINLCSQFIFKPLLNQYSVLLKDGKMREFVKMLRKQVVLVVALTGFGALMAYTIGTQVLGMIYNKPIGDKRIGLTMIVVAGGIFALCQLFYYIFVILSYQIKIMITYIVGMLVSILVTFFCVKFWGLNGAAFSFILTQLAILAIYIREIIHYINGKENECIM